MSNKIGGTDPPLQIAGANSKTSRPNASDD